LPEEIEKMPEEEFLELFGEHAGRYSKFAKSLYNRTEDVTAWRNAV
jgi:hypothetical protein